MKRLLFIIILLSLSFFCTATTVQQDSLARIIGEVSHKISKRSPDSKLPLGGCVVQLFFEKNGKLDSLYTVTGLNDGRFSFKNVPVQRVILRLQCMGYETQTGVYELGAGDNAFLMTMKEKSEKIQESKIVAEIPLMTRLRDTTIFNTQAIKSMSGDGLRDVLEQIPGFSISDNRIYYNGEKVSRTYVNGLLIFGDEAMRAVNALKADEVTQVKVYDEQSAVDKHRGLKNSRKERVLNVVTKGKFLSLAQYGLAAYGGADDTGQGRYGGAVATAFDSQMFNMDVNVSAANLEAPSLYYTQTLSNFISLKERKQLKEYAEKWHSDLFFLKHWKNRSFGNSLRGNYCLDRVYSKSASRALTEYFGTESSPAMAQLDTALSNGSSYRHLFSLNLDMLDTPLKSLSIGFYGRISGNNGFNQSISNKEIDGLQNYSRNERISDKDRSWSLNGSVEWTNNDVVKWRPKAYVSFGYGRNTTLSWTVDTLQTSFLKRQLSSDGYGHNVNVYSSAGVSSNLINTKEETFSLTLFANAGYTHTKSRQMTLNEWDEPSPVTDLANSYDYTRNEITSGGTAGFSYANSRDLSINGDASLNNKTLLNDEFYPADFNNRKNFLCPEYNLDVKFPEWSINSSLESVTPSIEQISNRISDTNPLVLTGGNPDLRQAFNWKGGFNYRPEVASKKNGTVRSLALSSSSYCTFNPIVSSTRYFDSNTVLDKWDGYEAQAGSMLNTYSNASRPSWGTGVTGEYSVSMRYSIYNLRFTLSSNYSQTSQFYGENQIWIGDWINKLNIAFMYNPSRKLRIVGHPGIAYLQSDDKSGGNLSSRIVFSNSLYVNWNIISRRLWFESEYGFAKYDYVKGLGQNHFSQILNAELRLRLLKDNSLILSLQAIDILNSGSLYTSSVNASYMRQDWNPTYGRYFLFNIAYVFRKKR